MRCIANVNENNAQIKRVMIYQSPDGVYLFGYNSINDCSAEWDYWFENIHEAKSICKKDFGVQENDWVQIQDPLPHCQHDWISPVRVKGRNAGNPEWGKYEKLVDGNWCETE